MEETAPGERGFIRPWMWKGASLLFALYIFALIAVYIGLAGRSVDYSYTIAGQPQVAAGQPASLRIGAYDIIRGVFLPGTRVEVRLDRGGAPGEVLYRGNSTATGFADAQVLLPADARGPASWHITLEPYAMEPVTVDVPVEIIEPAPDDLAAAFEAAAAELRDAAATPLSEEARAAREGTGPIRLSIVPEGGAAVDGLRSNYLVAATERDTGRPRSVEVTLELLKGMVDGAAPRTLRTNAAGLAAFSLTPVGSQRWRLTTSTRRDEDGATLTSEREQVVSSKSRQYAIVLRRPVWEQGQPLAVGARSLHREGALFGDLYLDDRWVYSETTGIGAEGGGFEIRELPALRDKARVRFLLLQTYGNPLAPGEAIDARTIALPPPGVETREVLGVVLRTARDAGVQPQAASALLDSTWLTTASEPDLDAALSYWLALAPPLSHQPHILLDTQRIDRDKLKAEKNELREPVSWLLGFSGAFALLIVAYLAAINVLRVRQRSRQAVAEITAELDDDPDAHPDLRDALRPQGLGRWDALLQIAIIIGTLGLFFAAIVVLVRHL